jgi:cysteine synthase/rhodanese-related sulfurtransferase
MLYNHITELIGNTPLLKIDPKVHGLKNFEIYAKLEYYNPFGSLKDRIAWQMLEPVLAQSLENQKTILESSSGNTAKALATLAKVYGLNFKTITNRIKVPEVRMMLQFLGAEVEELPGLSDCPDPNDPNDPVAIATNLVKQEPEKWTYTDQYFNELNWQAHYKAGEEVAKDFAKVDYYFGVLGTCGSTLGAVKALKDSGQSTKAIGVVTEAASWVPGGRNINELWETGFFDKDFYADIVSGDIQKAISGMQELNQKYGILAGPTSGLNYACMLDYLRQKDDQQTEKQVAVFIACDRVEPYMNYIKKYTPEIFNTQTNSKPTVNSVTDEEIQNSQSISPEDLEVKLKSQNPPFVVDIRGNFAFSIGHVPNSINILDELFTQMIEQGNTLPKNKEIVVVCSIGKISPKYATFLQKQGYKTYSLEGGINNWKKQNFELEKTL